MENEKPNKINKKLVIIIGVVFTTVVIIGGAWYLYNSQKTVYIENSEISAPIINLSPKVGGELKEIFVRAGDRVNANTIVARVGKELIKTKIAGLITNVNTNLGETYGPGQTIASMIDPSQLRVVGHLDEDKGLNQIHVGQRAVFTVDAFGSKDYVGTVDEISQNPDQSSVVFYISNTRQVKPFDVKVRFDISQYPELKNGMSAKIWVYKN